MTHLVQVSARINRAEVREHLAALIHHHTCGPNCTDSAGVASMNAAEAVLTVLHDLDLLGPLQTPQFHLVDDRAVITWPDDVDRVLIHRPLMDKIVDRINALSAALKAHHGGKGVRLDG